MFCEVSSAWLGYELPKLGVAGSNPALRISSIGFIICNNQGTFDPLPKALFAVMKLMNK